MLIELFVSFKNLMHAGVSKFNYMYDPKKKIISMIEIKPELSYHRR